ncbi:mannose-1-phosphate guanylyltransferase [Pontibacter sp. BT310]|jgi:mannose-1-phosphate guanylyltransferase|uniref:Mannose-1-phosphate guanylyltransferase n=1 Tax=Pontibacter populi TaxID=890055 RepID=A0ABS6X7F1_9BACT|nr:MULTISPECIES: mannose-1-phosphate guanylyltransferase [Pontibacter]MBJ6117078.1 mannose-1-phosphate guanylyltransferase [Pontibacter sp. BT310]MBR0569502.1 mannose-1-phosphate guanylyltransferase [Microvirga sp. STS03]MBW3363931.1 mannose-1-phosphate guanylyltransferase [Pontibacter populi]
MNNNTYVVIMAGGIGSRFWPFSRTNYPKQFHDVLGIGETMLQMTMKRFEQICPVENIFIVTNKDYEQLVKEQLPQLSDNQILLEPVGRNTAPCIAYASYKIAQINPNANLIVAPSDHVVLKQEAFNQVINTALEAAAADDVLITLGITPSRPDTGYGYIQFIADGDQPIKKVKTFTEKPNLELAQMFLNSGDFVWNSGIFIWSVNSILNAFRQHLSEISEIFEEGNTQYNTDQESNFIVKAYSHCRNISIDYGIMEKVDNVYVVLADIGWSDLGTWNSLYTISNKDEQANVIDGDVMLYDTKNCIIKTPKNRLVVVQGLEGYIIAEHDNVLMICKLEEEQKVKDFTADAKYKKGQNYI